MDQPIPDSRAVTSALATGKRRLRVAVVGGQPVVRESVARALATEPDFDVMGCFDSLPEPGEAADVALVDVDQHSDRASDFRPAHASRLPGRVLIVASHVNPVQARNLIDAGAAGIFLKEQSLPELGDAIRTVAAGGSWFHQGLLRQMLETPPQATPKQFTARELQVLRAILDGRTNKEAAADLGVSESLIKAVLQRLFHKTGVRSRAQLVRVAMERYPEAK